MMENHPSFSSNSLMGSKEMNSSSSMLDLLHQNDGKLHSKVTTDSASNIEWRRNEIVNELLQTEKDFHRDMVILKTIYADPCLKNPSILADKRSRIIFLNLEEIIQSSGSVVKLLEDGPLNLISKMTEIFSSPGVHFKGFKQYCQGYANAAAMLSYCSENVPTFAQFLELCKENEQTRNLSLLSFIIKPVQRICKYPLILRELKKCFRDEDESKLESSLEILSSYIDSINKETELMVTDPKLVKLEKELAKNEKLAFPGRQFIREDAIFIFQGLIRKPRRLFLLSDSLLIVKKDWRDKLHIVFHQDFDAIDLSTYQDNAEYQNIISLSSGSEWYLLTLTARNFWLEDLKRISGINATLAKVNINREFLLSLQSRKMDRSRRLFHAKRFSRSVDDIQGLLKNKDEVRITDPNAQDSRNSELEVLKQNVIDLERQNSVLQEEIKSLQTKGSEALDKTRILEAKLLSTQGSARERNDYYEAKEKESLVREVELRSQINSLREELKNQLILSEREKEDIARFGDDRCKAYEETLDKKDSHIKDLEIEKREWGLAKSEMKQTLLQMQESHQREKSLLEQSLKERIDDLITQNSNLNTKLKEDQQTAELLRKNLDEECKAFAKEADYLQLQVANYKIRLSDLEPQLSRFQDICQTQKQVMDEQKLEITDLLEKLKKEESQHKSQMERMETDFDHELKKKEATHLNLEKILKSTIEKEHNQRVILEFEFSKTKRDLEKSLSEQSDLQVKLSDQTKVLEALKTQHEGKIRQHQRLLDQMETDKAVRATDQQSFSKKLNDLAQCLQDGQREKDELKLHIQQVESQNESQNRALQAHMHELNRLNATLLDITNQYEVAKVDLEHFRKTHSKTNASVDDLSESKLNLERELALITNDLAHTKSLFAQEQVQVDFLKDELKRERSNYANIQHKYEEMLGLEQKLGIELSSVNRQKQDLARIISEKDKQIANLESEIQGLKNESDSYKKSATQANQENMKSIEVLTQKLKDHQELRKAHEEKEREVIALKKSLFNITEEMDAATKERKRLEKNIQEISQNFESKQRHTEATNESLSSDLEIARKEITSKIETCLFLQNECNSLQKKCKSIQDHMGQDERQLRERISKFETSLSSLCRVFNLPESLKDVAIICHQIADRYTMAVNEKMKAETTIKCLDIDKSANIDILEKENNDLRFVNSELKGQNANLVSLNQDNQKMIKDLSLRLRSSREQMQGQLDNLNGLLEQSKHVQKELQEKTINLSREIAKLQKDQKDNQNQTIKVEKHLTNLNLQIDQIRECSKNLQSGISDSLEALKLESLVKISVEQLLEQVEMLHLKQVELDGNISASKSDAEADPNDQKNIIEEYRSILAEIFQSFDHDFEANAKIRKVRNTILNPNLESSLFKIESSLGMPISKKTLAVPTRFVQIEREIGKVLLEQEHLRNCLKRKTQELALARKVYSNTSTFESYKENATSIN